MESHPIAKMKGIGHTIGANVITLGNILNYIKVTIEGYQTAEDLHNIARRGRILAKGGVKGRGLGAIQG